MTLLPETAVSNETALEALRDAVTAAGSQRAAAARIGVSQAYLGDVLAGRRALGSRILGALGLRRVVLIVPAAKEIR